MIRLSKGKLYKISNNYNSDNYNKNSEITSTIISIFIYAIVLMVASKLFKGIYVSNFFYALVSAIILSILNYTVKPLLIFYTMPITFYSLGLLYPLSNMIILWLCSIIMGNAFVVDGFINLFFISIFISIFKLFLDRCFNRRK